MVPCHLKLRTLLLHSMLLLLGSQFFHIWAAPTLAGARKQCSRADLRFRCTLAVLGLSTEPQVRAAISGVIGELLHLKQSSKYDITTCFSINFIDKRYQRFQWSWKL